MGEINWAENVSILVIFLASIPLWIWAKRRSDRMEQEARDLIKRAKEME